ncbi:MAG: TIGR01777 family oxidoreductase [Alphaproteobacteria bacterium]|nr:TIGR01777 family oxidoreductase [Alphaproteobacteria bacterium]
MEYLRQKTILLTGGTGFIGRPLSRALADRGAQILVLTRSSRVSSKNISYISSLAEISDKKIDIIINFAGEPIAQRWTPAAKQKIRNSRIETTSSLVGFIKSSSVKPSIFISASAIGYYGTDQNTEFNENTPPKNTALFSRELCSAWEAEALKAEKYGVKTVILRIGAVLEKSGGMLAKLLPPFRLGLGGPIGHGRQWLSWIDRDDLIRLILHTLQAPSINGPVNATAPNPVSNREFSEALADVLRRPCLLSTPAFALRAAFGDMADEIMLEGQKVVPRKAEESGFTFFYPTIQSSLEKIFKGNP